MHAPFAVVHALFALFAVAPTQTARQTALAHSFNQGRSSSEQVWQTSQRIYASHSNHTHMHNATEAEVHRLAQRAGRMSTSSLPPASPSVATVAAAAVWKREHDAQRRCQGKCHGPFIRRFVRSMAKGLATFRFPQSPMCRALLERLPGRSIRRRT
jgi:hypothetical protein